MKKKSGEKWWVMAVMTTFVVLIVALILNKTMNKPQPLAPNQWEQLIADPNDPNEPNEGKIIGSWPFFKEGPNDPNTYYPHDLEERMGLEPNN